MPPLGVSANADGTDNVLRQLFHEQPKHPDCSPQRVRVLSQMRTALAASRGLTLLRKNSRSVPEAVHIKNAFDFKLINAESGCAGGARWSLRCLLYVRFADE